MRNIKVIFVLPHIILAT